MAVIKLGIPTIATVQKVGNKLNEEGIAFASKVDDITSASEFISALIKTPSNSMCLVDYMQLMT